MLRSKASRWAAAPYLVWMVLFIVVPLGIVVWYALTNSDGQVTLANLTSIGRYASVFGRSLLLAAEAKNRGVPPNAGLKICPLRKIPAVWSAWLAV